MHVSEKQLALAWYNSLNNQPFESWSDICDIYLDYIHRSGRLKSLPRIVDYIAQMQEKTTGLTEVVITTAHDLNQDVTELAVQKILGTLAVAEHHETDQRLLGGMRIETRNKRYDFSLQGKLHALSKTLKSE